MPLMSRDNTLCYYAR